MFASAHDMAGLCFVEAVEAVSETHYKTLGVRNKWQCYSSSRKYK